MRYLPLVELQVAAVVSLNNLNLTSGDSLVYKGVGVGKVVGNADKGLADVEPRYILGSVALSDCQKS